MLDTLPPLLLTLDIMVCTLCRYVPVLSIEVAEVILLHGILFTLGREVAITTCTNRNGG